MLGQVNLVSIKLEISLMLTKLESCKCKMN